MSADLPKLSKNELVTLLHLRNEFPVEFYSNKTQYLWEEIYKYIKGKRVLRISIMGETRGGKSEVGSTICFTYVKMFNDLLKQGDFDNIDLFKEGRFSKQELNFDVNYVCDNEQVYKQKLKKYHEQKILRWGQIWQIDEKKRSTGGVGSMSDQIEMTNLNNIIAKFNQCEVWIDPLEFETRNTSFCLHVVQKDEINRVNWCLIYKPMQEPSGATLFRFLGWAKIPLHTNEEFRLKYNQLKNEWIAKELKGRADERAIQRSKTAALLVKKYPKYFEMRASGKGFLYGKNKQLVVLNRLMMDGKINTNFNELEKLYIIEEAQMIAEEEYELKHHKKASE